MDWSKVKIPQGSRIFKIHSFAVMVLGTTYHLEVDEFSDGRFSGHGEDSIDSSSVLPSVSGASVEECLNRLLEEIAKRS